MNLREFRENKGLQRKFVMKQVGISGTHLNDIEAGRVPLTDNFTCKLSKFYGIGKKKLISMYEEGKKIENS